MTGMIICDINIILGSDNMKLANLMPLKQACEYTEDTLRVLGI